MIKKSIIQALALRIVLFYAWRKKIDNAISSHRLVGVVVKEIALGGEGLKFDSGAGQIVQSVTNGSPPLQCFCGAVLCRR